MHGPQSGQNNESLHKSQSNHNARTSIDRDAKQSWPRMSIRFTYLQRFHVLLTLSSEFFFNFPSRYLFAIGLEDVFSFRWSLPPLQASIIEKPYSRGLADGPTVAETDLQV